MSSIVQQSSKLSMPILINVTNDGGNVHGLWIGSDSADNSITVKEGSLVPLLLSNRNGVTLTVTVAPNYEKSPDLYVFEILGIDGGKLFIYFEKSDSAVAFEEKELDLYPAVTKTAKHKPKPRKLNVDFLGTLGYQ